MIFDYREAELTPADRGLCDFAAKLTLVPGQMTAADLEPLRRHGLGDEAITIAVQVISYFNYINRVADGLGVDDEAGMTPSRQEWDRRRGRDYLATVAAG